MQVGGRGVATPEQHEPAVEQIGRVVAGPHPEVERLAGPRGAAAERAAGGGDAAQEIPEAPPEELGRAPRPGSLVVHDRQRARRGQVTANLLCDQVERLVPADALPAGIGAAVDPAQKMELALGAVDPLREAIGLPAQIALGELVVRVAFQLHHAAVLHVGDDPAAVGAVEGARGVDRLLHVSDASLSGTPWPAAGGRGGPGRGAPPAAAEHDGATATPSGFVLGLPHHGAADAAAAEPSGRKTRSRKRRPSDRRDHVGARRVGERQDGGTHVNNPAHVATRRPCQQGPSRTNSHSGLRLTSRSAARTW